MRRGWGVRGLTVGALALLLSVALGGCGLGSATALTATARSADMPIPAPVSAGGKAPTAPAAAQGGKVGPPSLYPDPTLTPGDVLPGVTAQEVCAPGYSTSVRNVSSDEKAAAYQRYGIANEPGKHEVDHFISLELGGSNLLTNLWPEPYVTPDTPNMTGAHEKDKVENYLHDAVCKNAMTLQQAQEQIRTDWYVVYLKIGK